ncbi:hypothetical protein M0R45_017149 [Rubus argutus]|uniref:Mediator of RNA polymerase II transcription subunit 6 n=1 Tax=Rubus argutus TaxID=59490 RepID=A0AAW1XUU1_RUBAR
MSSFFTNQFLAQAAQVQDLEIPQVPETFGGMEREEPTELNIAQLPPDQSHQLPKAMRGRGWPRKADQGGHGGRNSGRPRSRERKSKDELPSDWQVITKTRKSGKSAGQVDRRQGKDTEDISEPECNEGIPANEGKTDLCFREEAWLKAFPLDRNGVFKYFTMSPFYDCTCNNQQLRQNSIHPFDLSYLSQMIGIEYMLTQVKEPNLFVIIKQKRDSPEIVTPVATYYVLDGSIYQAPHLRNVLEAKMGSVLHYISTAASNLDKIGYVGFEYGTTANSESTINKERSENGNEQVSRVDSILKSVWNKLPPAPPPPPFAEGYVPSATEVDKELKLKSS